ncbi:Pre-mRNA-splicing factor cwf16 [Collariella sp. IMI 366227]|nr:Pre-mRNA-splicing factor cwf16 [Collariella sp. IMI 366227]
MRQRSNGDDFGGSQQPTTSVVVSPVDYALRTFSRVLPKPLKPALVANRSRHEVKPSVSVGKYYPRLRPLLVGRGRKPKGVATGPKVQTVRLMAPFSLRCVACGEYMYRGRKFNARGNARRREIPGDSALPLLHSVHAVLGRDRVPDGPEESGLRDGAGREAEYGAVEERVGRGGAGEEGETDDQRLDRLEREMAEREGRRRNAMAELEAKTEDAKREMAVADALDEIRSRNARLEKANREGGGVVGCCWGGVVRPEEEVRRRQEEEDAEAARRAFAFARRQDALEETLGKSWRKMRVLMGEWKWDCE